MQRYCQGKTEVLREKCQCHFSTKNLIYIGLERTPKFSVRGRHEGRALGCPLLCSTVLYTSPVLRDKFPGHTVSHTLLNYDLFQCCPLNEAKLRQVISLFDIITASLTCYLLATLHCFTKHSNQRDAIYFVSWAPNFGISTSSPNRLQANGEIIALQLATIISLPILSRSPNFNPYRTNVENRVSS